MRMNTFPAIQKERKRMNQAARQVVGIVLSTLLAGELYGDVMRCGQCGVIADRPLMNFTGCEGAYIWGTNSQVRMRCYNVPCGFGTCTNVIYFQHKETIPR